jgi:hypothetical protein
VLATNPLRAANDLPDWAKDALSRKTPDYSAKVSSVAMLHEEAVTVDNDGRRVMRERGVIKILQPGVRVSAVRTYDSKSGRIRDFQGWLIPPSGKPIPYAKERFIDVAEVEGVYEEMRMKVLEAGQATPGTFFAYEVTEEEKTVFTQYLYAFQERQPVLVSRFSMTMPPGWELSASVLNHDRIEPAISGNTYTWELRDLPWIEDEDYSPSLSAVAPRVVVSYFPSGAASTALRGLKDWTSVSAWLTSLVDPPAEPTDVIRSKAAQLTANATSEIEKIRAIGSFVQQTKYVSISLNVTRGGGYTPHKSDDVLSKNYGDCKDKVTLMRSLLKAAGIDSYLTTIAAEDRTQVHPEWASPMQFDHAIVAVRVSDSIAAPTVIAVPNLGRVLMFDPTDPITPIGDLPTDEQGSYALLVAGNNGALLQMPLLPASSNRIASTIEGELDAGGHITAKVQRQYFGQSGIALQAVERFSGAAELKKRFERSYSRRMPGAAISDITSAHPEQNVFAIDLNVAADRFGQIMQGRLFVVRPGLLASGVEYGFAAKQRTAPIKLEAALRTESIRIKLPTGFKLDELPAPAKIESPYGSLESTWTVENDELLMKETLEVRETLAPASSYSKVREFFEFVAGAHSAPVVLVKQ